jgi:hypothetical protein
VHGVCPRCATTQEFECGGRFTSTRSLDCPACHTNLTLTASPEQPGLPRLAQELGVPSVARNVFLDDDEPLDAIARNAACHLQRGYVGDFVRRHGVSFLATKRVNYDNFRTGLTIVEKFVDATCEEDFKGVTFAFVCVDKGSSRAGIFDLLMKMGIPFIDVGMGVNRKQGLLDGMLRMTYYSAERAGELREKGLSPLTDEPNDLYRTNIQTGELNALNACFAVVRFKQLRGFYFDELSHHHLLFGVGDLKIAGDAETDQD